MATKKLKPLDPQIHAEQHAAGESVTVERLGPNGWVHFRDMTPELARVSVEQFPLQTGARLRVSA